MASPAAPQEYQCDKCEYTSMNKGNFDNHYRYTHVGTICAWPACGVQTMTEERLRRHIKEDHCIKDPNQSGRVRCPWPGCGKDFAGYSGALRCCHFHQYAGAHADDDDDDDDDDSDSSDDPPADAGSVAGSGVDEESNNNADEEEDVVGAREAALQRRFEALEERVAALEQQRTTQEDQGN
ncbi:hypothetical protein F5Y13DRAFT_190634 [Hypoxylon sp. FL1857]|nr:hypothetical protein F5Y13DRAFT_190634 [Hypoxylon sp. FL1857]